MEKIQFSKEFILNYEDLAQHRKNLTINCVNDLGQKFSVTGRALKYFNWLDGITDDTILLGFKSKEEKYCVQFDLNYKKGSYGSKLYILSVKDDQNNILYTNPNAQELINFTKESSKFIFRDCQDKGRNLITKQNATDIIWDLKQRIGQTIAVNDEYGILTSMYCYTLWREEPYLIVNRNGKGWPYKIQNGDKIYLIDEKGKYELIGKYETNTPKIKRYTKRYATATLPINNEVTPQL